MTAEEISKVMNQRAADSVQNVGLSGKGPDMRYEKEWIPDGIQLPEEKLYDPERIKAVAAAVSDPNNPAFLPRAIAGNFNVLTAYERPIHTDREETPVDITDPLAHIRAMIRNDLPEADLASDDELMVLFDRWEATRLEQDDDTGGTQGTV